MKPKALDFIAWGLTHADMGGVPEDAVLPIPREYCGADPAHYLLGTIWTLTTPENIKAVYDRHYAGKYTWEKFSELTAGWKPTERATDCQGLNDAFLRFIWEGGDGATDASADECYKAWCGEKGKLADPGALKTGAAVFKGTDSKKTHVGFICGYSGEGPLVLEAQGIKYGVRVNLLKDRPAFRYYGIMDAKYDYSEGESYPASPLPLDVSKPMHSGQGYAAMQEALNLLGYKDGEGRPLVTDGKWGRRSREAWESAAFDNIGEIEVGVEVKAGGRTIFVQNEKRP